MQHFLSSSVIISLTLFLTLQFLCPHLWILSLFWPLPVSPFFSLQVSAPTEHLHLAAWASLHGPVSRLLTFFVLFLNHPACQYNMMLLRFFLLSCLTFGLRRGSACRKVEKYSSGALPLFLSLCGSNRERYFPSLMEFRDVLIAAEAVKCVCVCVCARAFVCVRSKYKILIVIVDSSVRGWAKHYAYEGRHKDRSTVMCERRWLWLDINIHCLIIHWNRVLVCVCVLPVSLVAVSVSHQSGENNTLESSGVSFQFDCFIGVCVHFSAVLARVWRMMS